jgi:hypothetical protein
LALTLGLVLAACGGSSTQDSGPTQTVKDLMKAIEDKRFDTIPDYACAALKEEIAVRFDFRVLMAFSLEGTGLDPATVLDALTFTVSDLEVWQVGASEDKAIVHVRGRLEVKIASDRLKELLRQTLASQAEMLDEDLIDQTAALVLERFAVWSQYIDSNIALIKEGGRWLVCGN